ncbi:MAG TPA: aminoglycoside phosphotransferase family protein [Caulobacteraceae bacterium]|jgi:aminoglycoside phosphotransferase (APT) family kinase protein
MSGPLSEEFEDRVTTFLGWRPSAWFEVHGGYTPAARFLVRDGPKSAFLKVGTTPVTVAHMHREIAAYAAVSGSFRPNLYGACEDPELPFLLIEDLSEAIWPPPWSDELIGAVLHAAAELHSRRATLRPYAEVHGSSEPGWRTVERDPAPFLSLNLAAESWLARALPTLLAAEAACSTEGEAATHFDLRSDNICFSRGRAIFIDWGEACLSNAKFDLGFWLPSLAFEGGPRPQTILPNEPEIAAKVSGFFAAHAGLPAVPGAPFVRRVQREQLTTSLPWACAALRLGSPLS